VNLQAEFRHRDTDQGDLAFNFDPDEFFPGDRRKIDEDVTRLGARFTPTPGSTVIFSGIYADRDEKLVLVDEFAGFVFSIEDKAEDTGYQVELQHILEAEQYNIITGIGALHSDVDFDTTFLVDGIVDGVSSSDFDREHRNVYLYGDFIFPNELRWTLGAGYVDFEEGDRDVDEFEPKLGVEWDITDKVRLRGAFFKAIKRPLVVDQTIEPTEVAGFNQLFDDSNGSKSKRYGLGIDVIINEQLLTGFEVSRREIDFLVGPVFEDHQEDFFRAYLNWMISDRWAFTLDLAYEHYENDDPFEFDVDTPLDLETLTLPVSIQYFAPSGLFTQVQATYLHQDLERGEFAFSDDGEENVGLLDVAVGYRLPQRRGMISLGVQNALDKSFFYQDDSFRSANVTRTSSFIPERRILLLVTIVF
jgi:outer membrane receptor protein involved in Fe transport